MQFEIAGQIIAGRVIPESVRGFNLGGGEIIQKSMPLRAKQPKFFPRGNASQTCSFEVCRLHEGVAQAAAFVFQHSDSLVKVGQMRMTESYDGKTVVLWAANGCIRAIKLNRIMGMSTFVQYEIEIGTVTDRKPTT